MHISAKTRLQLDEGNSGHPLCGSNRKLGGKAAAGLGVVSEQMHVSVWGLQDLWGVDQDDFGFI